jgi:hypothetical protein
MAYFTQAVIADDAYMRLRVSAAAAQQGCATDFGIDPDTWTLEWRKVWASSPGWDAAWESAQAGNVEIPGMDPGVVTDGMILAQVQSMMPFTYVKDHVLDITPTDQAVKAYVDMQVNAVAEALKVVRNVVENQVGPF